MNVQISRIHKFEGSENLKAFVDITIDGVLIIKGFKIIKGDKGLFVSFPSEQGKDQKWYETVKPVDEDTRNLIINTIKSEYNGV